MAERRRTSRHELLLPMRIEGEGFLRFAASRNVSAQGMLVATARELEPGARIMLRVRLDDATVREIAGRVVRVEPNVEGDSAVWPHRAAIALDDLPAELADLLDVVEASS